MQLGCVYFILMMTFAVTNATYTHQESNEDEQSSFNVVSTLSGGTESSRRHVKTNLELEPSYPYAAAQQPFGNAVNARHQHHHHPGHIHHGGAHCTHTSDSTNVGHDIGGNIDNQHGHERLVDPVSGAGFLDIRSGDTVNSRTATNGHQVPFRPVAYPDYTPSYTPVNPAPHHSYTPPSQTSQPYHPSYPTPVHGHNYPRYPMPGQSDSHYPSYPTSLSEPQPRPGAYQHGGVHEHGNHQARPYSNGYGYGYSGPRDHWDHSFKMNTEYKEDGVHKGPTHALTNNGYGFGSGYGGGYNGAFNRPGF